MDYTVDTMSDCNDSSKQIDQNTGLGSLRMPCTWAPAPLGVCFSVTG